MKIRLTSEALVEIAVGAVIALYTGHGLSQKANRIAQALERIAAADEERVHPRVPVGRPVECMEYKNGKLCWKSGTKKYEYDGDRVREIKPTNAIVPPPAPYPQPDPCENSMLIHGMSSSGKGLDYKICGGGRFTLPTLGGTAHE